MKIPQWTDNDIKSAIILFRRYYLNNTFDDVTVKAHQIAIDAMELTLLATTEMEEEIARLREDNETLMKALRRELIGEAK